MPDFIRMCSTWCVCIYSEGLHIPLCVLTYSVRRIRTSVCVCVCACVCVCKRYTITRSLYHY